MGQMVWLFNTLAVLVTLLIAVLYYYGIEHSLFWLYRWYDTPLHLLGGVVIGLWGAAVATRLRLRPWPAVLFVGVLALAVGIGWEVFENAVGLTNVADAQFMGDTVQDLVCDSAGALLVMLVYVLMYRPRA